MGRGSSFNSQMLISLYGVPNKMCKSQRTEWQRPRTKERGEGESGSWCLENAKFHWKVYEKENSVLGWMDGWMDRGAAHKTIIYVTLFVQLKVVNFILCIYFANFLKVKEFIIHIYFNVLLFINYKQLTINKYIIKRCSILSIFSF